MDNAVVVIDGRLDQTLAGGKRGKLVTTVIPMQNRHGKIFKSLVWRIARYQCGSTGPRDTGKQEVDKPYKQFRIVIRPGDDLGKLPEDLDPLWVPANPVRSHFFNGVSLTMPYLEPYLIRTMKVALGEIRDEQLAEDVRRFSQQEGHHFRNHMKFNEEVFEAFVTSGKSGDLAIKRGRIRITGLDEFDQYANIDLSIAGSVGSKLTYIDHPPLGFAAAIGIDPKNVAGSATTKLKLQFILEHTLTADQIDVSAQSTLRDVSVGNIFLGHGIHGSKLSLKVDRERMTMTGDVFIEKIPARLSWRENFGPKAEFRSRYDLSATISDVEYLSDLGLDLDLFSDDYIKGTVGAEIRFTVFDDVDSQIEVTADVAEASLLAPAFGWQKPKGVAGQANIVIDLEHALVSDIPEFSIAAADLTIKGSAKYSANGTGLKKIEFERIAFGRTDVAGALIPTSDGSWDAGFHGPSFDLAPMWEDILADISNTAVEDDSALPRVTLAVEIDRVWLGPNESVNGVSGTFAHENDIWETIQLTNILKSGAEFKLQVVTDDDGNRTLRMRSTNAGETLKLLGYYENMRGGKLEITGRFDDAVADRPLTGVVSVKDYRVVEAPVLAHVLSIMALTGILEALQGDGLAFNSLEIPFVQRHGAISLTEAFAAIALGSMNAAGATPVLVDLLAANDDRDLYLRHAAIVGLSRCSKAAEEMLALQEDPRPAVRLGAVLVLRRLRDARVALFLDDDDPGAPGGCLLLTTSPPGSPMAPDSFRSLTVSTLLPYTESGQLPEDLEVVAAGMLLHGEMAMVCDAATEIKQTKVEIDSLASGVQENVCALTDQVDQMEVQMETITKTEALSLLRGFEHQQSNDDE